MEMEMNSHLDRGIRVEVLAHFVIEGRELLAVAAPRRVKLHEHVRVAICDVRFDVVVDQVLHDGLGLDILNTNHDVNVKLIARTYDD